MSETADETRDRYLAAVRDLFAQIREWLAPTGVSVREKTVELREEKLGDYEAPALEIFDAEGKRIAEIAPAGAQVIGADGRIDLEGRITRESLLLYGKSIPTIYVEVVGSGKRKMPILKGLSGAGWYWIESPILRRARRVDRELLLDLLSGVSDYELAG